MNINLNAVVFWVFCTCVGFVIGGTIMSTVAGLAVGLGISLLGEILLELY